MQWIISHCLLALLLGLIPWHSPVSAAAISSFSGGSVSILPSWSELMSESPNRILEPESAEPASDSFSRRCFVLRVSTPDRLGHGNSRVNWENLHWCSSWLSPWWVAGSCRTGSNWPFPPLAVSHWFSGDVSRTCISGSRRRRSGGGCSGGCSCTRSAWELTSSSSLVGVDGILVLVLPFFFWNFLSFFHDFLIFKQVFSLAVDSKLPLLLPP